MKFVVVLFVAACLSLHAVGTLADSYRCGRKLIRTGDSAGMVLKRCGEPRHKDRGKARVKSGGRLESVAVQRWYYRRSSRSLGRVVLIHQGKVVGIEIE